MQNEVRVGLEPQSTARRFYHYALHRSGSGLPPMLPLYVCAAYQVLYMQTVVLKLYRLGFT